jgi:two-component system response regulator AlgR
VTDQTAPLSLVIVDDEAPARQRLQELLEDVAADCPTRLLALAENGLSALQAVQQHRPDVLLLDIRMPGMDGIELACHLQKIARAPAIVFTTAYDAYACQAFEVNAIDYLLKPIRADRLQSALQRVQALPRPALEALRRAHPHTRSHFSVSERGRLRLIPVEEVIFLKAELKYVTLRTAQREYLLEESLVRLEVEFADLFTRIHRNCLVARDKILEIGRLDEGEIGHYLRVAGIDEPLPVSRRQYGPLRQTLR